MAPRKKRKQPAKLELIESPTKQLAKMDPEELVCQSVLKAIDERETMSTHDRFTLNEKKLLLAAYNQCGFQVFQDMSLLQRFIPGRSENDLKGLVNRIRSGMDSNEVQQEDHLDDWLHLCLSLLGTYSRNKQINLDGVLADALQRTAEELESDARYSCTEEDGDGHESDRPNYPKLLKSFSQLLSGRFPDNMTPANARVSMKLFSYVNMVAKTVDVERLATEMGEGSWLADATEKRRLRQEMALKGLDDLDRTMKSGFTLMDLDKNENIEALCAELPKIKRITELLNPLQINESLASDLMDAI